MIARHAAILLMLAALAAPAAVTKAGAEVGDRWPLLAFAKDADCQLSITSSGRAMQITAAGLIPGEAVRLGIANGDMVPIRLALRASNDGTLTRYYFPFRLNQPGGQVDVSIAAARCSVAASAPWTRNLAVIP